MFVNGGTGGVGSHGRADGARPSAHEAITTVGSAEKAELCQSAGARSASSTTRRDDVAADDQGVHRAARASTSGMRRSASRTSCAPSTLLAPRGRIVVMAGRHGAADLSGRAVLRQGPVAVRLRHVQRARRRNSARCAEDINRWLAEKKLHAVIGTDFQASARRRPRIACRKRTRCRRRARLTGKIVVVP